MLGYKRNKKRMSFVGLGYISCISREKVIGGREKTTTGYIKVRIESGGEIGRVAKGLVLGT